MKKLLHLLCLIISGILVVSCYDDSALWDSVKDHESRISKLEAQCKELNTNIASLKTLVDAYLSADYITDVTPVMEGGEEVGFVITFAKNGKITIYHGKDGAPGADGQDGQDGKDGQDANAPKLGIRQDTDGSYYWTLNGDWLLDDNGDKIKAVGKDGADGANGANGVNGADGVDGVDGITPTLKIEEEYWYISYDNGQTWTNLGKAVGEDGKDSMFSNVYEDNGYIIFTLVDGTSYRIPTEATAATANTLDIHFSVEQGVAIVPNMTTRVKYTITGAEGSTLVRTLAFEDLEIAFIKPIDNSTGYLYITAENEFDGPDDPSRDELVDSDFGNADVTYEEAFNSWMSVIVIVTDSKGNQVIKALNFVEGFLLSVDDVYLTDPVAGSVEAKLKTNVDNDLYEIVIPEKCKDWISYVPTKAELREETLTFNVTANEGDSFRSANISLINELGQTFETFTILQRSTIAGEAITFADARVEALCVSRFDKNLDGVLTYEEAALVTDVEGLFENEKQIVSFDEFEHLSSVTNIPYGFFSECELLESVKLPESVMEIGSYAFSNCTSLKTIVIPEGVTNSYNYNYDSGKNSYWFSGCTSLESVTLPSTLKHLPSSGFQGCSSLESITLPKEITEIPGSCFSGCTALNEVICKSPITSVGSDAFAGCTSLKSFDLSSVEDLGEGAFSHSGLTSATIPETITSIPDELFAGCSDLETVIMHDNITSIGYGAFGAYQYDYDNYAYCSSLKSLILPTKLEYIGSRAFRGSAIEGEPEEGTSAKLLSIPANVKTIGYGAFYNCSNISGVKMLGSIPPDIDFDTFDYGTPIYVQNNALQAYTDAYSGHSYPILPYDMMGLSLTLELEVVGEGDYKNTRYYEYYQTHYSSDGEVDFLISAKVTGDDSKLTNVSEYGYYVTNNNDRYGEGTTYFPLKSLNSAQTDSLSVRGSYFEVNNETYVATANCSVGAYLRLTDGTVITYDKREMEFIYDRTPSIELIEAKQVETYRNGDNCDVTYEVMTRTSGAFWLNCTELEASGVGSISSYRYSYYDGDYKNTITWRYNVNEVPANMQIRFAYKDRNGSSFTSNRITLTADISEASLLETIYKTTNGESWTRSNNWCSDRPLSEWYGITTDSEGNVTSINLENNNLSGSLKMYLSSFAKLTDFNIDNNQLNTLNIYGSDNIKSLEMTSCVNNKFYSHSFDKVTLNKCDSLTLFTQYYCDTLKINDCHFSQSSQNNGISISGDGSHIVEIKRSSIPYISISNSYRDSAVSIENCLIDYCYINSYYGSIVVNGSTLNTCKLNSYYLTFQNSTASESWNGVTEIQLDIINSTCTGITNGNFNDDTVINLENATLWQSSWDEAPLGTFTRTLTGAEWPTLFQ